MLTITSTQNQKIKDAAKLHEARERKKCGLVLVEGRREIELARAGGAAIETLFVCEEIFGDTDFVRAAGAKETFAVSPAVYKKISFRESPAGILAVARPPVYSLADIKNKNDLLLVVLEAVEKPGNLGAIVRTADAAAVDAVIICDPKADIYNPNAIRSSQGTVFTKKVIVADSPAVIVWLFENKIKAFAATPAANKTHFACDFRKNAAIVLGTEDKGLSQAWIEAADEKIRIPMRGAIDSLNVSASAAIILYEAIRQRLE